MRSITLLFTDYGISKTKTEIAFCDKFGLTLFDFMAEFRKQMWLEDELTNEIGIFLGKGELVPEHLIEKFLTKQFQKILSENILLSEYPKTRLQYQRLVQYLEDISISIKEIWYIRQREPESFFSEYFKDLSEVRKFEKYGDEFPLKWRQAFKTRRDQIESIIEVAKKQKCLFVEMEYQSEISKEYITQQIDNIA